MEKTRRAAGRALAGQHARNEAEDALGVPKNIMVLRLVEEVLTALLCVRERKGVGEKVLPCPLPIE